MYKIIAPYMIQKLTTSACAILLTALLTACGDDAPTSHTTHSVLLVSPTSSLDQQTKRLPGTTDVAREISLGFKTAGQIATIVVKEGDYVRQGQLLATLDDKDYRLGVEATQIQYDQLQREVQRLSGLHEQNAISGNDYDKAVSGLNQLGVSLQVNKNKLEYTRLYAPTSGYVQHINFETAEMVNAGTPLLTLLDTRQMEVLCNIPVSLYRQRDRISSLTLAGHTGAKPVQLQLISIAPKADGNQLYTMRLALPQQADETLTSGQNVEVMVHLDMATENQTLSIPLSCLCHSEQQTYVMTYQTADSTVLRRNVTTAGTDDRGWAIVTEGLQGGERIVKAGATHLHDGERVRVLDHNSDTNIGNVL